MVQGTLSYLDIQHQPNNTFLKIINFIVSLCLKFKFIDTQVLKFIIK